MKIAFISYEYPPETSGGGIGTYVFQLSKALVAHGHRVTVFCGSPAEMRHAIEEGVSVYKILSKDVNEFRERVLKQFSIIHAQNKFDIVEGPEYGADGYFIKKAFSDLPYVIKLHSPQYLVSQYNNYHQQYLKKFSLLAEIKLLVKKLIGKAKNTGYIKENDIEYRNISLANLIVSPSHGLAKRIKKDWGIDQPIVIVRNLYIPSQALLNIPVQFTHNRVTLIGKMSVLKGLIDFVEAIPIVLKQFPNLQFRFIGDDSFSPEAQKTMSQYLISKCTDFKNNIEFVGKIPLGEIPLYLADTDVLVCNSLWENYPTVILEAMSAARIIIATKVGGITEMIRHGKTGFLIPAKNPYKFARAIIEIYSDLQSMVGLGVLARRQVLENADNGEIVKEVILTYESIIGKCKIP